MLTAFSHIIFDLDGVLLDTEPLYTQATQAVVGEFGRTFDWSIKGDMIGRSAMDGARYLKQKLDLPIEAEEYLRRRTPILEGLFETAPEMPGARSLVAGLSARGIPLGLATSSDARQYRIKTSRHDWFAQFQVVVCGDDARLGALKPAPDIFLLTAEELGCAPENCLVFEDSLAGVTAARAAGMQVIAMPDPNMDASRYTQASLVVESLQDFDFSLLGL
ncbi:MAG TPA: HAD-IA family hydrolase [Polyangiaceae bacterium]|nr:HAD-IA family hydrolase [Polyangiaceae bacterium]HMR76348.1 HAD-IA family hydrolase [Polyangiaceae bacterium]